MRSPATSRSTAASSTATSAASVAAAKLFGVAALLQAQRMLKQAGHRVRGLGLPGDRVADELVAAPQRVRQAPRRKLKALRPRRSGLDPLAGRRRNQGGYAARMSDSTSPISPPPKPPERQAEIRQLLAQVAQGDLSGTIPWEEVAAELGLPGRSGS
ncbi:MAG TPA: hypothetical protein VG276_30445 [Actinomycetes bacterium]|nr:hypothetical protein [Actinomycetes bacterium]